MKKMLLAAVASAAAIFASSASATLTLDYTVVPTSGGNYHYDFTLSLSDAVGWTGGDQYDWIVFGDAQSSTSALSDFHNFQTTDPIFLGSSSGFHNGPTLRYGTSITLPGWAPSGVGDSISWAGDSINYLGTGQLLWSILIQSATTPQAANFSIAQLQVSAVPEPATWAMMLLGFGVVGAAMRRSRKQGRLQAA